jgi:large subunit ribosomal protein L16
MLSPKKTAHRKSQKGRTHGFEGRSSQLRFGDYGLQAQEPGRLTSRQIEACRIAMRRRIRRVGRLWIRIFPDLSVTSKPTEVRMGKGKGMHDRWVARVKPGRILFEIQGVSPALARETLRAAAHKLPIATLAVERTRLRESR